MDNLFYFFLKQLSTSNDTNYISLTPLYVLAAQLYHVIYSNGGSVLYSNLDKVYQEMYGKPLKFSTYQIRSEEDFYNYFNLIFHIRYTRKKSVVFLHKHLSGWLSIFMFVLLLTRFIYCLEHCVPLPPSMHKNSQPPTQKQEMAFLPPPPPGMLNAMRKVSPPKPDTPPSPVSISVQAIVGLSPYCNNEIIEKLHMPLM